MKYFLIILLWAVSLHPIYPQLKDYYREVDQIFWVVNDIEAVKTGWRDLGFEGILEGKEMTIYNQEYKGRKTDIRIIPAYMNFGGMLVTWAQPLSEENAFSDYLKKYGEGAMVLMHRVASHDELNDETERMAALGVKVLQNGTFQNGPAEVSYVLFDTKKKGKYVLGIFTSPGSSKSFLETPNTLNLKFSQFAFAVKRPEKVSAFWQKLGFPGLEITHTDVWDKKYYGQPADYDMNLGWQRHGKIVYEWCIPLKPPTVYADFIKYHGEGIQHFGMNVKDIDQAIDFMEQKGFVVSQSGGWGEKGKPGSGRFAYINLENIGGETIELLWNYPD